MKYEVSRSASAMSRAVTPGDMLPLRPAPNAVAAGKLWGAASGSPINVVCGDLLLSVFFANQSMNRFLFLGGNMLGYVLMLLVTVLGFAQAPLWVVLIVGTVLTAIGSPRYAVLAQRNADLGIIRILATAMPICLINNTAYATLSYVVGRGAFLLFVS